MLQLQNITVGIADNSPILHELSLTLEPSTTHILMGPNGSGKSTCAYAIMGHPWYKILGGSIVFNGIDVTYSSPDKRAQLGIFLAMQQPYVLPGVTLLIFLKEMYNSVIQQEIDMVSFQELVRSYMQIVGLDVSYLFRSVNDGFSGGEKKRCELLQMLLLKPTCIILDEIDSGLDIDALKSITHVLRHIREAKPETTILVITHYQRLLAYIAPDRVHVMVKGKLVMSGDAQLATHIEQRGYDALCI